MEQKRNKIESLHAEPSEKPQSPDPILSEAEERERRLANLSPPSEEQEERAGERSNKLDRQHRPVAELEDSLDESARAVGDLYVRLLQIETSRGWKALQKVYRWREKLFPFGSRRRGAVDYLFRQRQGNDGSFSNGRSTPALTNPPPSVYQLWMMLREPSGEQLEELTRQSQRFSYRPTINLLASIETARPEFFKQCIESIQRQVYGQWELWLADTESASGEARRLLREYAKQDQRIHLLQGNRSEDDLEARNTDPSFCRGDFVAFLDAEDTLAADALYRIIELLQKHHDASAIYADEDRQDANGNRSTPFFKPDWSPELFLSFNYIGRFIVVRRELVVGADSIPRGLSGNQLYDLLLRLGKGAQILHIPRVLYHRRTASPAATNGDLSHTDARQQVLRSYVASNGIAARIEGGLVPGALRVRYEIKEHPKVAIVIATGGRLEFLQPCLESVFAQTEYEPYEVVVVDNSKGSDTQAFLARLAREGLSHIDCRMRPFNFSALNNLAVRQCTAPLVLFLNDDTKVVNRDWLTAMVEHGQRPSVGIVGAKLLYPNGHIQHAGVVMGIHQCASHAFKNIPDNAREYYFGLPHIVRECSAVTAACMLTKRDLFLQLGGFNERELPVAFQDPDYCLRVCQAGFAVLYTPYAVLVHHESTSKGLSANPAEIRYLRKKWAAAIAYDRYYNPNLTRTSEDYGLNFD